MSIQTRNISKQFGDFTALHDINLDFARGELTALLGPSGCGKTTLLRIIAGLEHADRGSILLDGQDVSARHPRERQVGFVFQHYALFKHMNVFENVAFGLRVKPRGARPDEATIRSKVKNLLELVQLDTLGLRFPSELSGGQRQRIALARALAVEPRVLLLDEPFGALDASVRKQLRRWLRELHEEIHVTTIFVTHDQEEALEVADRLVIVNRGRIEQTGAPQEVYDRPATPFVYGFLGDANRLQGQLQGGAFDAGSARFASHTAKGQPAGPALGFARPHEIDLERYATGASGMLVQLQRAQAIGPLARLELLREDTDELIEVVMPAQRYSQLQFKPGEMLVATPRRLQVFADLHASHGSQA